MRVLGDQGLIAPWGVVSVLLGALAVGLLLWALAARERRTAALFKEQLKLEFSQLSAEFLGQRAEQLKAESESQLGYLLSPLREQLHGFQALLRDNQQAGLAQHVNLKAELHHLRALNQQLSSDANSLVRALRGDTKTQGNWGEAQLERLLESSGLHKGVHFATQVSVQVEGARAQPDVLIHLPHGRDVVIDAKVSLSAYARHCEQQPGALKDHLISLRTHITGLAARAYERLPGVRSLDFVLLFVPIEGALIDALRADPELSDFAQQRQVVLCSNTTLLLMLKTISSLWRIDQQNNNAEEIARQAGLLYDKFAALYADLGRIEQQLTATKNSFSEVLGQIKDGRGNLLSRAENLKQLGARTTKKLKDANASRHPIDPESP